MIIEFTGLPGSGKSTICKELENWLKSLGYDVVNWIYYTSHMSKIRRVAHKIKVSMIFLWAHPILFRGVFRLVRASRQNRKKDVLSQLLNLVYVSALYQLYSKEKYQDTIVLFDQGKIQALISLIFGSGEEGNINLLNDSYLDLYPNDVVIQIDVSFDEVLTRLKKREGAQSRIEKLAANEQHSALEQFNKTGLRILKEENLYKALYRINASGLSRKIVQDKVKEIIKKSLS